MDHHENEFCSDLNAKIIPRQRKRHPINWMPGRVGEIVNNTYTRAELTELIRLHPDFSQTEFGKLLGVSHQCIHAAFKKYGVLSLYTKKQRQPKPRIFEKSLLKNLIDKLTFDQIKSQLKCSQNTLRYNMELHGLSWKDKRRRRVTDKALLATRCRHPEWTQKQLANRFGVSRKTISVRLKSLRERG
jgi:DNA-binding XRE family transcriptional regulator